MSDSTETDSAINEMLNGAKAGTEKEEETTAEANASEEPTTETESAQTEETEVDDWKRESRKWEARAKENTEKAQAYDALAESHSELEKKTEKFEQVSAELEKAQRANTILNLRLKHNVSEEDAGLFLTASDEETLEKQAQRLSTSSAHAPKPDAAQGRRNSTGEMSTKQQGAAAVAGLFN